MAQAKQESQWNVKVKIVELDRGNVVVKNRWEVNDVVTVQIEPHATVGMLKQRIALLVAAQTKHQTIRNADGEVLGEIAKLMDSNLKDGSQVELSVQQPKEAEEPEAIVSDDEGLWTASDTAEAEALPDAAGMSKELTDDEMDAQAAFKQAGAELMEDGDVAGALAKQTAAILVGAPSALMLCKRAEMLLKLKRAGAAEKDTSAAIAINQDSAKAYKLRGKARRFMGDYAGCLSDLNTAQSIDFDDGVADMHDYVKKRVATMAKRAKQQEAKAAKEAATDTSA